MASRSYRNMMFDAIEAIAQRTTVPEVSATFADATAKLGLTAFGINALPPPNDGADPVILTESTPTDFRDCYIAERFYLVDHICAHARVTLAPFRYAEAPFRRARAPSHERFMEALDSFGMRCGIIVPMGRPTNVPSCVWLAGENPDLTRDAVVAIHLISLFAAATAHALTFPAPPRAEPSHLTQRERDVLQWISAGKTSWEIAAISGLSERAINKTVGDAMIKLGAVTRTQAVVNAIRKGEIEL